MKWFTSMFSSKTSEENLISAGTLNATKITALLTAITTAILAVWPTLADTDGPFGDMTAGQKLILFLGAATLIVTLVVADMLTRAYVTAKSFQATTHLLDKPQDAEYRKDGTTKWVEGTVVGWQDDGKVLFAPRESGHGIELVSMHELKELALHLEHN